MNKNTALARIDRTAKSVKPPLKKNEILAATARVLYEEQLKKKQALVDAVVATNLAFETAIVALTLNPKTLALAVVDAFNHSRYGSVKEGSVTVKWKYSTNDPAVAKVGKLHCAWATACSENDAFRVKPERDILNELKQAAAGQVPGRIEAIIKDEEIRKRLLDAGVALLKQPTALDRMVAISA